MDNGAMDNGANKANFDPLAEASRLWEEHYGPSEAMAVVTSVVRVQQLLVRRIDQLLRSFGLTFARYEALVLLGFSRRHSLPMSIMGQRLMVHQTSVTSVVDRLEKDGLVLRAPHPTDRRTTLVALTDAGASVAKAATAVLMDENFGLPPAMALEDMRRLVGMLRSIRELAGDFLYVAAKADALEAAGSPSEPGGPVGQPPALTPRGVAHELP